MVRFRLTVTKRGENKGRISVWIRVSYRVKFRFRVKISDWLG